MSRMIGWVRWAISTGTPMARQREEGERHPGARPAGPEALDRGDAHEHGEHRREDAQQSPSDQDGGSVVTRRVVVGVRVGHAPAQEKGDNRTGVRHARGACDRDQSTHRLGHWGI